MKDQDCAEGDQFNGGGDEGSGLCWGIRVMEGWMKDYG